MRTRIASLTALALLPLAAAACGAGTTAAPRATSQNSAADTSQGSSAAPGGSKWPYSGTLPNGTPFKLAASVATKVKAHSPINYVFSYAETGRSYYSAQSVAGYKLGLAEAKSIYPIAGKIIAPSQADINQQISQVEALYNAGQLDCLSVSVSDATSFSNEVNKLVAAGIPVFTVGAPTEGNQLANFTQIPEKEGAQAAQTVLAWMHANHKDLKIFAMSSGAPSASWAQGRMKSFMDTIKQNIPDATFVNDPSTALNTTFDPTQTYNAYNAFLASHKNVQFIINVDQGAGGADRAIHTAGLDGKTFTIGWNVTPDQLDGIEAGTQVAVLDQKWDDQAAFGAKACATFFAKGQILPNTQKLVVVEKPQVAEARAQLAKLH